MPERGGGFTLQFSRSQIDPKLPADLTRQPVVYLGMTWHGDLRAIRRIRGSYGASPHVPNGSLAAPSGESNRIVSRSANANVNREWHKFNQTGIGLRRLRGRNRQGLSLFQQKLRHVLHRAGVRQVESLTYCSGKIKCLRDSHPAKGVWKKESYVIAQHVFIILHAIVNPQIGNALKITTVRLTQVAEAGSD